MMDEESRDPFLTLEDIDSLEFFVSTSISESGLLRTYVAMRFKQQTFSLHVETGGEMSRRGQTCPHLN